jgi:anti-sigma28 factor (negative regulator of flagellin synthesis)
MRTNVILEVINYEQSYITYALGKNDSSKKIIPVQNTSVIIEISEQAKLHLLASSTLKKQQSRTRFKPGFERSISKLIERSVSDHDLRNARIHELRAEMLKGEYDFDDEGKLSRIADLLSLQLF